MSDHKQISTDFHQSFSSTATMSEIPFRLAPNGGCFDAVEAQGFKAPTFEAERILIAELKKGQGE
jgi:hypothetical protein